LTSQGVPQLGTPCDVSCVSNIHTRLPRTYLALARLSCYLILVTKVVYSSGKDEETSFLFRRISVRIQYISSVLSKDSFSRDYRDFGPTAFRLYCNFLFSTLGLLRVLKNIKQTITIMELIN